MGGELKLVTNPDKTVTVEVDGLSEDSIVPGQQDVVTCRIVSVNPRFAKCHILCVGDVVMSESYRGQIRKEDVRQSEKDRVEMYNVSDQETLFLHVSCHWVTLVADIP